MRINPCPPRVIMFDFDGVIVDSFAYFYDSLVAACAEHGFTQINSPEAMLALFDVNMYEGMVAAGIPAAAIDPILATMGQKLLANNKIYQFFPGIPQAIRQLASSNRLYIITSNLSGVVGDYLRSHHLQCFADILGSDSETSKVRKIRKVMAGNPMCQYFYIGDTRGDMIEGRQGGASTVAVLWGWHDRDRLAQAQPDFMVQTPSELAELFCQTPPHAEQ